MKKIIVTGATCMMAIALIKICMEKNVEVVAISRQDSKNWERLPKDKRIERIVCDLNGLKELDLSAYEADAFFHFAWNGTGKGDRDNPFIQEKNIAYALDAVRLAKMAKCRIFVGTGSQAEYGWHNGELITEDMEVSPNLCYGISKYASGRLCMNLCEKEGLICAWTRIFSVYGINCGYDSLVWQLVDSTFSGETMYLSSCENDWDFLYEDDAGMFLYNIGKNVKQSCVINLASGERKKLKDYIFEASEEFGEKLHVHFAENEMNPPNGFRVSVERLHDMTGYIPQTSFRAGIHKMWEYRENQKQV